MKTIDGIDYIEHGDLIEMEVHRGGGYYGPEFMDSSIYEGGAWTKKAGVVILRLRDHNPECDVLTASGSPNVAWVEFLDGDHQATDTRMDRRGFPDGPKTFLRKADPEHLAKLERRFS